MVIITAIELSIKPSPLFSSTADIAHPRRESPVLMLWTAPATGIAMCPIPTALEERRESAVGYKQTLAGLKTTPALHPGADLPGGVAEGPFLTQAVL